MAVLDVSGWVVTASALTARDVDTCQAEGVGHVGVVAPGGSGTAPHCEGRVPQP